jgi:hypothetical protein
MTIHVLRRGRCVVRVPILCVCMLTVAGIAGLHAQAAVKTLRIEERQAIEAVLGVDAGTRRALLVGINNYAHPDGGGMRIEPLTVCVRDVKSLAELLRDPTRGRFPAENVVVLTDAKATKRNIEAELERITSRAQPTDMILFYFSGHGYQPKNAGASTYLIPHDADMDIPDTSCLNFADIETKILSTKATKVVTILDACHSGGVKPRGAMSLELESRGMVEITQRLVERERFRIQEEYGEKFENAEGKPFLLSSDASEVSWEMRDTGHSVFTHFLLEGLNGAADTDRNGVVTFSEVAEHVEATVADYTARNFQTQQRPTHRFAPLAIRGDIPLSVDLTAAIALKAGLDQYRDSLAAQLEALLGTGSSRLRPGEIKQMLAFAVHTADRVARATTITSQESAALLYIEDCASEAISVSDYREAYPQGAPQSSEPTLSVLLPPETRFGTLRVHTIPPGAQIYLNGRLVGRAPKTIREVPAGSYSVRLVLDNQEIEKRVEVSDADIAKLVHRW